MIFKSFADYVNYIVLGSEPPPTGDKVGPGYGVAANCGPPRLEAATPAAARTSSRSSPKAQRSQAGSPG
jgi:hypothetical protein